MSLHTSANGRMHFSRPVTMFRAPRPRVRPPTRTPPAEAIRTRPPLPVEQPVETDALGTPELHLRAHEGDWAVFEEGADEPLFTASTKRSTLKRAKTLAHERGAALNVYTRTGKLQRTVEVSP